MLSERDKEKRDFNLRKQTGNKSRSKTKPNEIETEGSATGASSRDESPDPSVRPKEPSIPSGSAQQAAQDQSEPSIRELMSMMTDLKETITTKMDTVLSEVVSFKRDLAEVKKNIAEMEHSVADTSDRIAEVEDSKLPNLRKEIDKVRYDMEEKMLLYEIHNRKLNLLIYGVTPQSNENVYEEVYTVLANLLGVSRDQAEKIPLTNAHRVPRARNPRENQSDRANNPPDPIIVRFSRMVDRDRVLRAFERPVQREDPPRAAAPRAAAPGATKVSNERITIRSDLPPSMKRERGRLAAIAYKLRQQQKVSTRIIINKTKVILQTRKKQDEGRPDPWSTYRSWCSIGIDFLAILFLSLATAMLCADGYVYLSELWGRSSELLFLFSYVTYLIQVLVIPAYSLATRLRAVFVKPSVASRCPLDPEFVYRRVSIIHSFHKTILKPHFMLLFNVWPLVHAVLRCAESKIINHKCHIEFYIFSDVSACVGFIMYGSFWYIMYLHRVSLYYELKRVARVTQRLSVDERVDDARRYICRVHRDYLVLREMMGVWMAFTMVTATWGIMSRLSWDYAIAAQDTSVWSDKHRIYMDVVVWSEKAMFLTFPYFALGGVNLEYLWQKFRHALERRRSYQHRSFWNAIQMHTMYINNVGSRELRWTLLFALIGPYLAIQSKWNGDQNLEFWNGPFNCSDNLTHT
ncbi:uncharacterized protein [Diadema setosum]|uniref:uncharacterized protein n=1 Tax=Diadema setosum TaxID=31175 RepID=UPI003B3B4FBF